MTISRPSETESLLQHRREAVPNDRLAHLVRDAGRALVRSLSERAGVMEPTTFSAIKTMERLGYVVRSQHDGDRKKIYIHVTHKSRQLKERLVPLAEEVNRIAVDGVAPDHVTITRAVLLVMIENLARDEFAPAKPLPSTRVIAKLARSRKGR